MYSLATSKHTRQAALPGTFENEKKIGLSSLSDNTVRGTVFHYHAFFLAKVINHGPNGD